VTPGGSEEVGHGTRPSASPRRVLPADYDRQADAFDRRTGLDEAVCRAVARAVVELSGAEPGDLVVEAGAGTGLLGAWLAREPVRYLGFDFSPSMLRVFRGKLAAAPPAGRAGPRALLFCADGEAAWPLADGTVRAVFSSRAIHLLDPDHVTSELLRLAAPRGATLLVGRIRREETAVRARMARELRARLRARGLPALGGDRRTGGLLEACRRRGAEPLAPRVAGRWPVSAAPRESLDTWAGKTGLAGTRPAPGVKEEVLAGLGAWAARELGDLDRPQVSEEAYVIEGVRLPSHS
jgi:ubiquinone/menaquinone biosynthesis C-methylase UbiE